MSRARRPIVFGEVLFDVFPDGTEVLGGAAFNVAWGLQGLGLEPLFVSRVGEDALGRRVLDAMESFGLDTTAVEIDSERPTGRVTVELEGSQPSYTILSDQAYDRIEGEAALEALGHGRFGLLYHGTLAIRSEESRRALSRLARGCERSGARRFVDINLRSPWWTGELVDSALSRAGWAKLNDEEVVRIGGGQRSGRQAPELQALATRLIERCGVETIILTRGAEGASWIVSGEEPRAAAAAEAEELVDTVGAGDAFSAVTIAGLLEGWTPRTILSRAATMAASVCGLRGATTTDPSFYGRFAAEWGL